MSYCSTQLCSNQLFSSSEINLKTCIGCAVDELKALRAAKPAADKLAADYTRLYGNMVKLDGMLDAEQAGSETAERGMPVSECPHPVGTELCVSWTLGWQKVETERKAGQAVAVVRWTSETLEIVREIAANGGSHEEIVGKVGFVLEKLREVR